MMLRVILSLAGVIVVIVSASLGQAIITMQ